MADPWIRDHLGPEVRARAEFLGDLHAELAATWRALPEPEPECEPEPEHEPEYEYEPAPTDAPAPPLRPARAAGAGRRRLIASAAALLLAAAAAAAFVLMRGDDGDESVGGAGAAAGASTVASSAASVPGGSSAAPGPTAATGGSGTAVAPGGDGHPTFTPACTERPATGVPLPSVDRALMASVGPLPATPTFTFHLPALVNYDAYSSPLSRVWLVDGGLLLVVHDYGESAAAGTSGTMLALIGLDGDVRWVRCLPDSLVSGMSLDPVQEHVVISTDAYHALSLEDGTIGTEVVAGPPERPFEPMDYPFMSYVNEFDEDGGPLFFVTAFDEAREELWRDETLMVRGGEAFATSTVDGVSLALGCEQFLPVDPSCSGPHLRRYDIADGTVLWDVPGALDVAFVADGAAMVSFEEGHRMVSLEDGSFLSDTVWPPGTFDWECCGGSDYHWTYVYGGVAVNLNYQTVTVWFPEAMNLGSYDISLP